jgi:hypothetical protein
MYTKHSYTVYAYSIKRTIFLENYLFWKTMKHNFFGATKIELLGGKNEAPHLVRKMEGTLWCKSPLCPTLLLYVQSVTVATVIPFGEKRGTPNKN